MHSMERSVLILGARGMLGRELAEAFAGETPVLWDKEELDITNERMVREKIAAIRPDVIINVAAYTDVDACEKNEKLAFAVNADAVKHLAEAALACGATLVHYSTDYVFDGGNSSGYSESDVPANPVNVYGASKLLGEKFLCDAALVGLIRANGTIDSEGSALKYYLIRTSWLFGAHGKNFVQTMLELARTKNEIRVVNDQHGKPTYAKDLALATKALVTKPYPPGVYHLVNEPATTWHDFAHAIFDIAAARTPGFRAPRILPCASSEFPRPAQRPAHGVLLNTKFPLLRQWREAVADYFATGIML